MQRFRPVVEPAFEAWAEGEIVSRIAVAAGLPGWGAGWDVREASKRLCAEVPAFAGLGLDAVGSQGAPLR